jgi:hypothetical protein
LEPETRTAGEVLARFRACRFCHAFSRFFNSTRETENIWRTTVSNRSDSELAGSSFVVLLVMLVLVTSSDAIAGKILLIRDASMQALTVCLLSK